MTRRISIITFIGIFLLGILTGSGLGYSYGKSNHNLELENQITDLQNRSDTIMQNYLALMQEYNNLFAAKAVPVGVSSGQDSTVVELQTETPANSTTTDPAASANQPTATPEAPTAGDTAPLSADFTAEAVGGTGQFEGPPPQLVRFTDLSTGAIVSWLWDFGDGTTSTEQNPEHIFNKCPGEKEMCTVTLTVCTVDGECDTETKIDFLWISESCTGC